MHLLIAGLQHELVQAERGLTPSCRRNGTKRSALVGVQSGRG